MCIRDSLQPGDRIRVRNRELIPADATLLSPSALIDYSFVSGEAEALERKRGDILYAGGPVSYTHLDVYKRQAIHPMAHKKERIGF